MNGEFAAFLFMSSLLISFGGLVFFWMLTRHRERTQMIEKGADASLFQSEPRKKNYFIIMLLGVLFVCLSLGIGLGFLLDGWLENAGYYNGYGDRPGPYFFGIFFMLGVGFVISFFLNKKLINKE